MIKIYNEKTGYLYPKDIQEIFFNCFKKLTLNRVV